MAADSAVLTVIQKEALDVRGSSSRDSASPHADRGQLGTNGLPAALQEVLDKAENAR